MFNFFVYAIVEIGHIICIWKYECQKDFIGVHLAIVESCNLDTLPESISKYVSVTGDHVGCS